MSYAFCYGPSGSGKSTFLRREIIARARKALSDPEEGRKKYIVVVPEQYSMQTQRELVQDHPSHVLMNIDVLSFGRLAHRVFEETGQDPRKVLNDIGKSLLLRRVAARCAGDLKILQRGIRRTGMIDEIKSVLSEFMQYGIGEDQIRSMADYAGDHGQNALRARLLDIEKLYSAFRQEQAARYVTSEETLDLLAEAIPRAESLRGCVVIFDGFTGFTTVQYRVLRAILRSAREVIFSLPASEDRGPDAALTASGGPVGSEEDLFYLTRRTMADIIRIASEERIPRGKDIDLTGSELPRFRESRVLAHLEGHLFRYPAVPFREERAGETQEGIRLFAASTPQEEVRQIFAGIRETIRRTGCAYRDFAIVTADLETYGDLFEQEAVRSQIPVYIDRTSGVFHNILIEGIRSVLQISAESFSYASVFRYLRSGLSSLTREETDLLENYCLANGIRGRKKWSAPFDADCEEPRKKFLREISPVTESKARTAADRTRSLYAFLLACGAQNRMDAVSARFGEEGDVVRKMQYGQIYRAVIDLLDQVYELIGEERISARDYLELLEAGFAQIRLGTLPQRVDRILVGDMERTRLTQIRHLFFAGTNEGNIPRSASRGGILSDMDREFLAAGGTVLAPTPRQRMFSQRLYLYLNMTKPSDSLTVSFAKSTQDGKGLRPSYLISSLKSLFPALQQEVPEHRPAREQIVGRMDGLRLLADRLRDFAENGSEGVRMSSDPSSSPMGLSGHEGEPRKADVSGSPEQSGEFALLYGFYTSREVSADPAIRRAVGLLRRAALYRYRPESVPEAAEAIYGSVITGGISRMETAARCLMWQHLRYGLRLHEREIYEFEAVDAGTLMHAALQRFDGFLRERGLSWTDFTPEEGAQLSLRALQEEAGAYRNLLLYKSARDEHLLQRYARRIRRTVDTLQYQIRRGDLLPAASELGFGTEGAELPPIRFDLGAGRMLKLIGRIDRVDLLYQDRKLFLRIMDYKSGRNDLDPDRIRRGLQLQLISYMNALTGASGTPAAGKMLVKGADALPDEIIPSAMLYYRIDDPVLKRKAGEIFGAGETPAQLVEEEIRQIRKELRPTGLVYAEEESVSHLDRSFTGTSDVIPVRRLSRGGYAAGSRVIDEQAYRELSTAASDALCRLADKILDGTITASPAVLDKNLTACGRCPYRAVCGFDLRIPGYSVRRD